MCFIIMVAGESAKSSIDDMGRGGWRAGKEWGGGRGAGGAEGAGGGQGKGLRWGAVRGGVEGAAELGRPWIGWW